MPCLQVFPKNSFQQSHQAKPLLQLLHLDYKHHSTYTNTSLSKHHFLHSSKMTTSTSVAIMGAGLSGLSLALALHQKNIACVLYETRPAPLDIGGAIMLSPNALRILDSLNVLPRLKSLGYSFDNLYFRNEKDELTDTFEFGSFEKYGYSGLRVYRYELINILLDMVKKAGIQIEFGKKFDRVISETKDSVTWLFADGSEASASMLVGADGIHSRVRSYLYPEIKPKFTNMVGITAAIPTEQLELPEDGSYQIPVTLMNRTHGAFVIAPQLPDGSEVLIGKQYKFSGPEPDREEWDRLLSDKTWCIDFLREGSEKFPSVVERAASSTSIDKVNVWPFYLLPKLDSWTSQNKHGRVVIVGDAAHAIPPSAGQGVNQAFEDIYTFAGVLGKLGSSTSQEASTLANAMKRWHTGRQQRVDQVIALNEQINKRRLPSSEDQELEPFELEWLYSANFEEMIEKYARDI